MKSIKNEEIDWTKPLVTKSGLRVTFIRSLRQPGVLLWRKLCVIKYADGTERSIEVDDEGNVFTNSIQQSGVSIVNGCHTVIVPQLYVAIVELEEGCYLDVQSVSTTEGEAATKAKRCVGVWKMPTDFTVQENKFIQPKHKMAAKDRKPARGKK